MNHALSPLWLLAEKAEMDGLIKRKVWLAVKRSSLSQVLQLLHSPLPIHSVHTTPKCPCLGSSSADERFLVIQ